MIEQLDFFDELDIPDEQDIWVKLLITYQLADYEGIDHRAMYEFVDKAPDFPMSNGIIDAYMDMDNVMIEAWHSDLPEPQLIRASHEGNLTVH